MDDAYIFVLSNWVGDEQTGPLVGEGIKSSFKLFKNQRNLISMWKCEASVWIYKPEFREGCSSYRCGT